MSQIYVPGGRSYRLHTSPVDMAGQRIANRFGVRGLAGEGDPRSIPARGPSVVLPLVRGKDGWFYLSDGHRAQTRGVAGLGDTAADLTAIAQQLVPGSALRQEVENCVANPTPYCVQGVSDALSTPYLTASQYAATTSAIAAGANTPYEAANVGAPPGTSIPTPQEAASAQTGKPNQSVPPAAPNAKLPTGTGADGGNPMLTSPDWNLPLPAAGHTGLYLLLGGAALFFLLKGK